MKSTVFLCRLAAVAVMISSLLPAFGAKDFNAGSIRGAFYIYQPKEDMQVGKESKLMVVYNQYADKYEKFKECTNVSAAPTLNAPACLEIVSGPRKSSESDEIKNKLGEHTMTTYYNFFHYIVKPLEAGECVLDNVTFTVNGTMIKADPITLTIAPGEEPEPRDYTLADDVAEDNTPVLWAYVNTDNVNLRDQPSTAGKVCGKTIWGDFYSIQQLDGDWALIEIPYGGESSFKYINTKFITILNPGSITPEDLENSFSFDDGKNFGILYFTPAGDNQYEYTYMIKNRDMQEAGGNGIVDQGYGKVLYWMESLQQPDSYKENDVPTHAAEFDRKKGYMFYAGYLWKIDK